jgi:hypothetical protein
MGGEPLVPVVSAARSTILMSAPTVDTGTRSKRTSFGFVSTFVFR